MLELIKTKSTGAPHRLPHSVPENPEAIRSGDSRPLTATAGEPHGSTDPHLAITVLFMRLDEAERREFLEDVRQGRPAVWQIVSERFAGGARL